MSVRVRTTDPETQRVYLDVIRRVRSNDPMLYELSIGDIIRDECNALSLAAALRGNTNIRSVTFREYVYVMGHFHLILHALPDTRVSKISVGPQSPMLRYTGECAVAVGRRLLVPSSALRLRKLDLNQCRIGPEGAIALATVLGDNRLLTELHLPENAILDAGACALAHMIKTQNRSLKEITLDDNGITPHGQHALRNAIFDDSSFDTLAQSNHVLQSYFHNPRNVFGQTHLGDVLSSHAANMRSRSAKVAVTKKLKRVLQRKYRVKLHFESFLEMDANIMPHVLGWVGQRCDVQLMYEFKPILLNLLQHNTL